MIYKTAYGMTPADLDKVVAVYLKDGYKLYGNPYAADTVKYQALIKEEPEEEK